MYPLVAWKLIYVPINLSNFLKNDKIQENMNWPWILDKNRKQLQIFFV